MPNLDTLTVKFSSKGTATAVKNIKDMGYAVRNLAQTLKTIDGSKLQSFANSMDTLKKSIPTKAQTDRMTAFGTAVKDLSSAIGTADIGTFSKDMATLGSSLDSFKRSSVNSIKNAVTAMQELGQQTQQTASTIDSATTKTTTNVSLGNAKGALSDAKEIIATLDKVQVKAKGVTGIMQKMGIVTPTKAFKTLEQNAEKVRQKYEELRSTLQKGLNTGEITSGSTEYKKKMAELDALRNKYDELIQKQRELALEGNKGFTINPNIQKAYAGIKDTVNGVKKAFGGVSSIIGTANKYINSFIGKLRSLGKTTRSTKTDTSSLTDSAKKLANEFLRVSKMLKLMVTRMALRAVIKEVGNGFKSLALHSDEFNNSMSSLINGSKKLGYSFSAMVSPLINALAPAIVYIINLLTKLANVFNQVISSITGASTWNKAKDFTDSWRDSIAGAGKELKKTVLGFDELNQLQENKSSSGGGNDIADMFETLPIESKWKELADKIKKIAKDLFEPIKNAWAKVGDFVKKSWKYALNEVLELGKDIAKDFFKVWKEQATQKIFENIFEAVGWIGVAVGNLAKRFREAWNYNETGLKILRAIRDIVLIITEHIKNMAKATADWADNLNFKPLLTSIQGWLESLKPAVDAIMGVLEDFYNQVVLKFTKWVVESGLPSLIDVFKRFNEEVDWEGLREKLSKLWDHLEPFMETIGEGLIIFIERVTKALAEFLNGDEFADFLERLGQWMDTVTPEDVADAIEKLVKAIIALKVAGMVVSVLATFGKTLAAIGAIASGVVVLLKGLLIVVTAIVGINIGTWLGSLFDPETYGDYTGITGAFKLIYDLIVAIKDEVKILIDDFKTLFSPSDWGSWLGALSRFFVAPGFENLRETLEEAQREYYSTGKAAEDLSQKTHGAKDALEGVAQKLLESTGAAQNGFSSFSEYASNIGIAAENTTSFSKALDTMKTSADNTNTSFASAVESLKSIKDESQTAYETAATSAGSFYEAAKRIAEETKNASTSIKEVKDTTDGLSNELGNASKKMGDLKNDSEKMSLSVNESSSVMDKLKSKIQETKESSKNYNDLKASVEKDSSGINSSVNSIDFKKVQDEIAKITADASKEYDKLMADVEIDTKGISDNINGISFETANLEFDNFSTETTTSMEDATKAVDDGAKDIEECIKTIQEGFTKDKWTFSGVAEGLKKTFKDAREGIASEWNQIANKLNGSHEVGTNKIKIDLPKFARGGFPEDGLFMANHSELVGTFNNGKTAVANNAQIVEGISAGVYNAVSKAVAGSDSGSKYISNEIIVDGEVIARTITKAQDRQSRRYSPSMA